jgi:hypothetical protein
MDHLRPLRSVLDEKDRQRQVFSRSQNPWPLKPARPRSSQE